MTEISKANLQRQTLSLQEKMAKEAGFGKKGVRQSESTRATDVRLAMRADLVEFLLVVKQETGTTLQRQAALGQREGTDGLNLETMEYNGTPLIELSPEEAQQLIAEDGHFGVTKTAQRITDFVLSGADDDLDRLQAGREGVLKGFQEAEELWGGKLPEISYQTLEKTLELIDAKISELGGSLVDVNA